jgi:hypothetical protein
MTRTIDTRTPAEIKYDSERSGAELVSRPALGGACIAVGCIWLICAHRATPQVMLGIVAGFMILRAFRRQ